MSAVRSHWERSWEKSQLHPTAGLHYGMDGYVEQPGFDEVMTCTTSRVGVPVTDAPAEALDLTEPAP